MARRGPGSSTSHCFLLAVAVVVLFFVAFFPRCFVAAEDEISHDDDDTPRSPNCNNKFQLVSDSDPLFVYIRFLRFFLLLICWFWRNEDGNSMRNAWFLSIWFCSCMIILPTQWLLSFALTSFTEMYVYFYNYYRPYPQWHVVYIGNFRTDLVIPRSGVSPTTTDHIQHKSKHLVEYNSFNFSKIHSIKHLNSTESYN